MDATELVHLPDGTILDPVYIAAIYPTEHGFVRVQLMGAATPHIVSADSEAHAEEIHAYLVACKTLSKRGAVDGPKDVEAEIARQGLANYVYRLAGRVEEQRESHHDLAHELRALSAVLVAGEKLAKSSEVDG